jgi:hypothetical protein
MSTPRSILQQIARIQDMERGKLCPMRGGRYFNHQTWENGRNVVRYVTAAQAPALQKSIAGYQRFQKLTQNYVDLIVRKTRQRRIKSSDVPSHDPERKKTPSAIQAGKGRET